MTQGEDSHLQVPRGASPADTLLLGFQPPDEPENEFLLFGPLAPWDLVRQPQQIKTGFPCKVTRMIQK